MDSQETRYFVAIIVTGAVFGIFVVYFFVSIIRQQRRTLHLQKENILAELRTMEKERARIAKDLHDDLGPILSVIKFQIDSVETTDKDDRELLESASMHVDDLISRVREIANNLMPSTLLRKGLIAAIEEYKRKVESSSTLKILFCGTGVPEMAAAKSINIYRIVQEVVHNTVKHAQASAMEIHMETENSVFRMVCKDNGKGFDYGRMVRESNGLGLKSLQGRARVTGGSMRVESKAGVGTAYLFEIPI